jgi:ankyrin repeat protein
MIHPHSYRLFPLLALGLVCAQYAHSQSQQQESLDETFLEAVQNRDRAKIQELLDMGANINARSRINRYYALQYAINWPDANLVKWLLDKGADVELKHDGGDTALMLAASANGPMYTNIVRLLLERGADVRAGGNRALLNAANEADPEVVRLLLKKGADLRARDSEGNTVLMYAAEGDSLEVVRILLDAGADVEAVNELGETVLMKAASVDGGRDVKNRVAIIKRLLDRGIDINAKDKEGKTALLHAAYEWMTEAGGVLLRPQIIRLLLERGADINARDNHGNTSLMTTVQSGNIEGVRMLLARGAMVNLQNRDGWTAMMYAKAIRQRAVFAVQVQPRLVAMLKKAGANE